MSALGHLRHAVTDGPDGIAPVRLPARQDAARRIKLQHGNRFWCSRQASGCGGNLIVIAGEVRTPHFRHLADQAAGCALASDPIAAAHSYEHLDYQQRLRAWLIQLGWRVDIEKTLHSGGRADLHIHVRDSTHTIEVQLSPISDEQWAERDARYRRDVDHVTWLYGPASRHLAASAVARDGVALLIRRDASCASGLQIGTRTHDSTEWSALDDCHFDDNGLATPQLGGTLDAHLHWLAELEEEEMRRQEQEQAELANARQLPTTSQRPPTPIPQPQTPHSPLTRSAPPTVVDNDPSGTHSLAFQKVLHPEACNWSPAVGWTWLEEVPAELRDAARLMAYIVQRIYLNGPIARLTFSDIADPHGAIECALLRAGLIDISESTGHRRWNRRP